MILDTIPGRAAVLALTLHATACAHSRAAPSTPRISIAVAPIGFGPDNGLTAEEQAECELGKEFFEELNDEVGQSFALSGVADPRGAWRASAPLDHERRFLLQFSNGSSKVDVMRTSFFGGVLAVSLLRGVWDDKTFV